MDEDWSRPMDEVSDGIFIGHCGHAQDTPQLDVWHITHVLSVESLKPLVNKKFQHKFVELDDDEEVDLLGHLEECMKFIGDGLKEGGKVLIHCAAGVSRSTSVTVAFLMQRDKITRDEALSLIKETRPFACPNDGFMEQLALFEAMGYQIDTNNEQYKKHKLISKTRDSVDTMDEVSEGIFIGDRDNAQDTPQLDVWHITHVLSVESFKPEVNEKFQHKFVELDDDEEADLLGHLEECIKFIGDALKEGGKVLIHCAAGISRSTSVTVAVLMQRDKITRDEALILIKETRPFACPNYGFMQQLALFEAMGYQIDPNNEQYKKHKLLKSLTSPVW